MTIIFLILIILASVVLGLIVLIQNPKGGGLAGNIAGFSSQFMGVKQTTDVLEKGTWVFASIIGILCLFSSFFISKTAATPGTTGPSATEATVPTTNQPAASPNQGLTLPPQNAVPPDTGNK